MPDTQPRSPLSVTARLARRAATHPRRTLTLWGVAIVAALALTATALHGLDSNGYATGQTDSNRAVAAIHRAFPAASRASVTDVVVISSARLSVRDPAFKALTARLERQLRRMPGIGSVSSYLDGAPGLVSRTGQAALIELRASSSSAIKPAVALVQATSGQAGLAVAITGDQTVAADFQTLSNSDLEHGELAFGLPAALIVLVLVFGSLVAGVVPLALALVSILVSLGLVALLSQAFTLSTFVTNMLTGMGLALGIDYCLFILSRYREERGRGHDQLEAITLAGASASRAVLFSGSTFVVAMFGMLIVRTSVMRSLAVGAIAVAIVSVLAALTLLPALLSVLGDRINALAVPLLGRNLGRAEAVESRFWGRIVAGVLRRPALSLTVTVAAMLAAAVPLTGLHVGSSGVSTLPSSLPSKLGFASLERSFPARDPYPVRIVAVGGRAAAVSADMAELERRLATSPRFGAGTITTSPAARTVLLDVPIHGDPNGAAMVAAVRRLRGTVVPDAFADSGATVSVGGRTSQIVDYFDAVTNPTPYVLAFVLGLSFVLLLLAFRSVVVALVSLALNLLSVGAAYGLLTLVFVHGFAAGVFGFQQEPYIEAWVPLFLFSVLFGLSMDYQVFLMSRIKERHDAGEETATAVAHGVASTARIITGAALIIVVVFIGFARGQLVQFQQMGFGVAVALLLDATVIRSVVLPSLLSLLGERTWYLPAWLRWLPNLAVEQGPNRQAPGARRSSEVASPA